MIENGMGRVRLGRFLVVAAPATVVSLGFGVAIIQGSVAASLSSAEPFSLTTDNLKADQLGLSLASTTASASVGDDSSTTKKAALARVKGGNLSDLCIGAKQKFPILGTIGLKIASNSPVKVGNIDLNADSLGSSRAKLPPTNIGTSAGDKAVGGTQGGFGLRTDNTKQGISLNKLDAKAYGIRLNSGINLESLSINPQFGAPKCTN
ncbi:DUF6230 family protein [Demetria terragena]|uniref:DUF6230 family protein n=1 Tax=Demetria terragena TaxID=63959 RepID=UPI00038270A0|nr:DUF6230 family protein [Demetria terragena]